MQNVCYNTCIENETTNKLKKGDDNYGNELIENGEN